MSKVLGLAFAAALVASPLHGQDSLMQRLRNRADSLLSSWREAQRLADVADSLERVRATAGSDTIAVGALRIIANPSPLPLREAAARAWPAIDSLYGSAAADLVQHPYIIRAVDPDSGVRRAVLHVGVELPWDLDMRATTRVLLTTVTPPRFDIGLGDWLGATLRPTLRPGDEQTAVYLQLVTVPSAAVRGCFVGDIARCKDVLQLGDSTGLLGRWYVTPAEREALVSGVFGDYFARGGTARHCCSRYRRARCRDSSAPPPACRSFVKRYAPADGRRTRASSHIRKPPSTHDSPVRRRWISIRWWRGGATECWLRDPSHSRSPGGRASPQSGGQRSSGSARYGAAGGGSKGLGRCGSPGLSRPGAGVPAAAWRARLPIERQWVLRWPVTEWHARPAARAGVG